MTEINRDDCDTACLVANNNRKDIQTLFRRLDEERADRKAIMPGVPWTTFWVILVAFATITYGTLVIMWAHFNSSDDKLEVAIQSISQNVAENTNKVDVVIARINDFIQTNKQAVQRTNEDQSNILRKLEDIRNTVQQIQVKIGKLEKGGEN